MKRVLVTGAAGFIGAALSERLLKEEGPELVAGLDNLTPYYDVALKEARLRRLKQYANFHFHQKDLSAWRDVEEIFLKGRFDTVVNLAAQPGVRYSIDHPRAYLESNLAGFLNVLEGARHHNVAHLVFASSSSVYGANTKTPYSVHDNVDHPMSLYAATKKSNELMAHSYASLYGLPVTGLRFFTVYGPWGRPDMAYFKFTKGIIDETPIDVYNHGRMSRDFTYIDDIVQGLLRVMKRPPKPDASWSGNSPDTATSYAPYRLYNIGNHTPVDLMRFVSIIEECVGKKANLNMLPMQPGDVPATYADIKTLLRDTGFKPQTPIEKGIENFVGWYREYYGV